MGWGRVKVALAARAGETHEQIVARGALLDQRLWHLPGPLPNPRAARSHLHANGIAITSLLTDRRGLDAACSNAAELAARAIVVEGGALEGEPSDVAADRLVRALHAPLAAGAPLALRNAAGPEDLLGVTEVEWLLSELPRLALWFDPARAMARQRAGGGASLRTWIDAYADRCTGVFAHGLGRDGLGGAHPSDDGVDWAALCGAIPRSAPWVLAMDPETDDDTLRDAQSYLRSL